MQCDQESTAKPTTSNTGTKEKTAIKFNASDHRAAGVIVTSKNARSAAPRAVRPTWA